MKHKRKELRKHAKKKKLHCVLLFNNTMNPDPNFLYLTGYDGYGCLMLLKNREVLFVPQMEQERALKIVKGIKVTVYSKNLLKYLKKSIKGKAVGIDYTSVTLSFMKVLKKELKKRFVDISSIIRGLRSVKTEKEIRIMKKACNISDRILAKCLANFRRFRTEEDVRAFLEREIIKNGCELSFPPIIASASSGAEPHHTPKKTKLRKGFCIIDFGIRHKRYCTDTTRTVYLGKPSEKEKEVYNFVLKAQKEVVNSIRPGQKCSKIYELMIKKLGKYSKYFIHALGHGVGIEIHELPDMKPRSKTTIKKGMVFTIEPGIYIKGRYGIRIEDTLLMAEKPVLLTKIPKDLLIISKS